MAWEYAAPFPRNRAFLRLGSSILMPHSCGERRFWGAGGDGTPSSSGRHHTRHNPGLCQAQSSLGSTGRVNPDHSTHFPFPLPGKKITYFLQEDDDFALLIAAFPVAWGFSRLRGFKILCFPTKKHFQYLLGSFSSCSSEEDTDSSGFCTNPIG